MTTNKRIFIVCSMVFLGLVIAFSIWQWGILGAKGIAWQDPRECLPLQQCHRAARNISYGVFDPAHVLDSNRNITVEHVFLSWTGDFKTYLVPAIEHAKQLNRKLFVAVEPWPTEKLTKETLLSDVSSGKYDAITNELCTTLGASQESVWISWGHEMDHDLTERYPWSDRSPQDFIAAYRHFVSQCRSVAPNIQYVWSPVGDKKLEPYWPGADVVDFVGVPIYSFPEFDKKYYGSDRTFAKTFTEKYNRVKQYEKPIIVVELGVTGEASYQQYWLDDMKASVSRFPLLSSVILFSSPDTPGAWGADISTPDWRLKDGVVYP